MKILSFYIPGEPKPKQSARFRAFQANGKTFVQSYQKKEVKEEERSIKLIVSEQLPKDFKLHEGPIVVISLNFYFPLLKSFSKKQKDIILNNGFLYKTTKPDLTDNLAKGLFDALQGIVYANDSQICEVRYSGKYYSNKPGTILGLALYDNVDEIYGKPELTM